LLGFCAPNYCNATILQNYTDRVLDFFSRIIGQDLRDYVDVKFVDPDDLHIEKGFWYYFTCVLISVLILLTLLGTFFAWFTRKQAKKTDNKILIDHHNDLREALMTNKESAIDVLSKQTAGIYLQGIEGRQDYSEDSTTQNLPPPPLFIKVLTCFDLAKNYKLLINTKTRPGHDENLNVLFGIRSLAFAWVVFGHTCMLSLYAKNIGHIMNLVESVWLLPLIGALYAVDVFFYLSGFFTGFILIGKLQKSGLTVPTYLKIFLHRWIRLWPAYALAIFFYWKISVYLGDDVLWYNHVDLAQQCSGSFWKNLLFMDNVLTDYTDSACFVWGWYLACDIQMFLSAPLLCWVYCQNRERAQKALAILLLVSFAVSYAEMTNTGIYYVFVADKDANGIDYFGDYYINPVVRMSPYLVGIWLGCTFKDYKDGKRNIFSALQESTKKCWLSFIGGILLMSFLVFYPRTVQKGYHWSDGFAETWSTFSRPLFALGAFMTVMPCLTGRFHVVRTFMSQFYFLVISRLSFSGYLMHFMLMEMLIYDNDQLIGLSQRFQTCLSFAFLIASCACGLVLYLLAEKPFANIELLFMGEKKEAEKKKENSLKEEKGQNSVIFEKENCLIKDKAS